MPLKCCAVAELLKHSAFFLFFFLTTFFFVKGNIQLPEMLCITTVGGYGAR
jgi:hypothetical protein